MEKAGQMRKGKTQISDSNLVISWGWQRTLSSAEPMSTYLGKVRKLGIFIWGSRTLTETIVKLQGKLIETEKLDTWSQL